MSAFSRTSLGSTAILAAVLLLGCESPVDTPEPTISEVNLSASQSRTVVGEPIEISVDILDQTGGEVSDVPVTWTVEPAGSGEVSGTTFHPVQPGPIRISAEAGGVTGTVTIAVLPHRYELIPLGTLGGHESMALGLNDHGQVVGYSITASGARRAFVWSDGEMRALPRLPEGAYEYSTAYAINNAGVIAGRDWIAAVLWVDGEPVDLGYHVPPGIVSDHVAAEAAAIDDAGNLLINVQKVAPGPSHPSSVHRVRGDSITQVHSTNARQTTRGWAMNSRGDVAGQRGEHSNTAAFSFVGDAYAPIPGLVARDVNEAGVVVGAGLPGATGWIWREHQMREIHGPGGFTDAYGINDLGHVVGRYIVGPNTRGFIWVDGAIAKLEELTESEHIFVFATAVNDAGEIAGTAWNPATGQLEAALLRPLPPATP